MVSSHETGCVLAILRPTVVFYVGSNRYSSQLQMSTLFHMHRQPEGAFKWPQDEHTLTSRPAEHCCSPELRVNGECAEPDREEILRETETQEKTLDAIGEALDDMKRMGVVCSSCYAALPASTHQ